MEFISSLMKTGKQNCIQYIFFGYLQINERFHTSSVQSILFDLSKVLATVSWVTALDFFRIQCHLLSTNYQELYVIKICGININ